MSLPSGGLLRYDYNRIWDESLHFIVFHLEYERKPGNSGRQEAVEEEKGKAITANGQKKCNLREARGQRQRRRQKLQGIFPHPFEKVYCRQ